ncbi:MAG: ornithine cyclodeaminase family protein [Chloroflexi bacterium]|nr:ornithine cyclodeaminase family protein [Chloroflexota bacterium]
MALFLNNDDVRALLPMSECIEVLDDLFQQEARGLVDNRPRERLRFPDSNWTSTLMGGTVLSQDALGFRTGSATLLYNTKSGALDAVIEPAMMAWIRTGAASGLAAKYMSRPDASVLGVFGTGRQAVTQVEGIAAVRDLSLVKVYSRSEENRTTFAETMRERLGIEVVGVATPEECVQGSHIVDVITSAWEPVFDGALLDPGTCVIAAGVNSWQKREIDATTIRRASVIAVDNLDNAKAECGELIWAAAEGWFRWTTPVELHEIVSGKVDGYPSPEAITLFESQGIGIEDVAASAYILKKARAQGVGLELPF